jgi:CNT family concentrative nucleoside transporter
VIVATYALCGFANFSSIAIQIGGIGGLAPERRGDLSRMGFRAMIAGTLASFMTAAVVTMIL